MIETDVRLSSDGHVMVIHDETVDRTSDGSGSVVDYMAARLGEMDAGARFLDPDGCATYRGRGEGIPRLDDVLEAFPDTRFNIEAKEARVAAPLAETIRRHRAEKRVLLAAEFEKNRVGVRDYPGPWGASRTHVGWFFLRRRLPEALRYVPPVDILQVPEVFNGVRIVDEGFIAAAHRMNIPVQVWTVDDEDTMRKLLAWGVDGIQTDRPDRLARVLHEERGRPLPPGLRDA